VNFDQIKRRGWVGIDDNPDNPIEVSNTLMGEWINEAVQDLTDSLHIMKTQALSVSQGAAWLPDDYLEAVKLYDGAK
jgi:predicted restriction endonuclease